MIDSWDGKSGSPLALCAYPDMSYLPSYNLMYQLHIHVVQK